MIKREVSIIPTSVQKFTFNTFLFNPCYGESGEFVQITGEAQNIFHLHMDKNDGAHLSIHFNTQRVKGVGLTSGLQYMFKDSSDLTVSNRIVPFELTWVTRSRLIAQGQTADFFMKTFMKATVNANGVQTVEITNIDSECSS